MNPYEPNAGGIEYLVLRYGFYGGREQTVHTTGLNARADEGWTIHTVTSDRYGVTYVLERKKQ